MRFVANLRDETIDIFLNHSIQPVSYLLSSHRVTPDSLEASKLVRELGVPLIADNGTKSLIDDVLGEFSDPAAQLAQNYRALRRRLKRSPRLSDVPAGLRKFAIELADAVRRRATELSDAIDSEALLQTQLSMNPTDLIAQEDFTVACWMGLGIEKELTGFGPKHYAELNRRSLTLYHRIAVRPECSGVRVFAVLAAGGYDSARLAGKLAAEHGARHLALGVAGIMKKATAVDFFELDGQVIELERSAPLRYIRLPQILRGLVDGYVETGAMPESFHCLGLGAPPMLPVAALALSQVNAVSTDATSPIHDAVRDRVLYDPLNDGNRISTLKAVRKIVAGEMSWSFASPFARSFRERFGHDEEAAQTWWLEQGGPVLQRQMHLRSANPLTTALPLFAEADEDIKRFASRTHIAMNHWVLGEIARDLSQSSQHARAVIRRWRARVLSVTTRGLAAAELVLTHIDRLHGEKNRHTERSTSRNHRLLTEVENMSSLVEVIATLQLEKISTSSPKTGWMTPLFEEVTNLQRSIVDGDWSDVLENSTRCMGVGQSTLQWLIGRQYATQKRRETSKPLDQQIVGLIKAIARGENGPDFLSGLRDRIKSKELKLLVPKSLKTLRDEISNRNLPETFFDSILQTITNNKQDSVQWEESMNRLAQGKITGVPFLDAIEKGVQSQAGIPTVAIACASRGLLGWVHAEYNLTHERGGPQAKNSSVNAIIVNVGNIIEAFDSALRTGQMSLYGALTSARPPRDVAALAHNLATEIESRLPSFVSTQANVNLTVNRFRELGKGGSSEKLGALAVRMGLLIREALASHAACYRLSLEFAGEFLTNEVSQLKKRAAMTPFDCKLPNGKNVSIHKLDSVDDGTFVEILGVVRALSTQRTGDGKLVSSIELLDPSSGSTVQAAVIFVHLPHAGLTIDSFCQLHGVYRKNFELIGNKPGIQVDRLSISQLKKQSWRVAFLQLADPWFPYWRNQANIYWAVGPHRGFDAEEGRQGAAELIFLPMIIH